ncbi:hypothetical protein CDQ92_11930 [Sphingopyxis bauzanensis]|uniref:Uncharacterized protein n=1 Tax=Sphingopyxis bauzanensis TaxID=651663 RepID=A0A246JR66_9SPHN|nr:hypothetical protein CDQ92_11930 [Sphingopyxis bauzanensis]GGJ62610.1 hypothetical protein GCM10011393_36060 [Sphingopyxis bauzanensis]
MRLFRWSALALVGVTGGMLLGEMTVGTKSGSGIAEPATYSHLSTNPDAAAPPVGGAAPCLDCRDSYGVAARLRADRESRMSDEFRELGAVDLDPPAPSEPDDGYRYGGRFPDPPPRHASSQTPDAQLVSVNTVDDKPLVAETSAPATDY